MKIPSHKGFTLVELMIVIAVMGIMAAIAVPNYRTYMAQRRLNGAARQVMSDLMAARMKAVSQNNEFKVFFLANNQYKILDDNNNNGTEDTGESSQTKDIQTEYYDVTLSANNNPIFQPNGTASNLPTINLGSLSNSSWSKSITISSAGRVKIN